MKLSKALLTCCTLVFTPVAASAADLEVTHWWTSGGGALAVGELAKAFNATGNKWVDAAIGGGGGVARSVMISRITGGAPMGATQFNFGRQAEELIAAGLMQDITDVAEAENWAELIRPKGILESCTVDGRVYCAPLSIHSWEWLWLSHRTYREAGLPVPKNWHEFVASAPALRKAGKVPLAMGSQPWQSSAAFGVLTIALGGFELWTKVHVDKDPEAASGPEMAKVFEQVALARSLTKGSNVQLWNQATNMLVNGRAGGQIIGDWAQSEFWFNNLKPGKDYSCLVGLGLDDRISIIGDAFYFPKLDDPEKTKAQKELARLLVSRGVQKRFNLKKGGLPIRADVDFSAADMCMKKGIKILNKGKILPTASNFLSTNTLGILEDLLVEFWNDERITASDVHKRFAQAITRAD